MKKEKNNKGIKGLSEREVKIIAWLEFYKKYFFSSKDIEQFFKGKNTLYRGIQKLLSKKRIIKINQNRYYLVPIKAKSGSWSEHPFVIIDEICNGENYYINGYASANFWHLTDQIPSTYDIYTTNRQGIKIVLNTRIIFHRVRNIDKSKIVIKKIKEHNFTIINKKESKKWLNLRE
jgi:predicted transcriptional regulator of viral defense system